MNSRAELHQAIDKFNNAQVKEVMAFVQNLLDGKTDPVLEPLRKISGIRLPSNRPQQFERVQLVKLEGEGELANLQNTFAEITTRLR